MFKMIILFALFLISFTCLWFAAGNIQFVAAASAMIASAFGLLIIATAEHDRSSELLTHSDLYDYSAE